MMPPASPSGREFSTIKTAYNGQTLKLLLKRGALLAAANWPVIAIQCVATTTLQALLAVPVIGAAILVAVLLGADLVELLQGSLRDMFTRIASALLSEPVALVAFVAAFVVALLGGSVFMFLVKGGVVDVLIAAHRAAGPIEQEPMTFDALQAASSFTLDRFTNGCRRLFKPYLTLGLALIGVYVISGALYLAFVLYGFRVATNDAMIVSWTFIAALSAGLLVAWITIVNLLYLLMQIVIAADDRGLARAAAIVIQFIRARFRELAAVFGVVFGLIVIATVASALAWSGVGLVAFVPLVGLAVLPLQLAALLVRSVVFEYLGLTALGAYITLYLEHRDHVSEPTNAIERPFTVLERPA